MRLPSEKILAEEQQYIAGLKEGLRSTCVGVIVSYKGITMAEDAKLREDLREAGDAYRVVKSALLSRTLKNAGIEGLGQVPEGTTAVAYSNDNYASGARILFAFADKSKTFEVKMGFIDGGAVSAATIRELAELPSKEVLVAEALGGLSVPIAGFITALNRVMKGLVIALNTVAEKQVANT